VSVTLKADGTIYVDKQPVDLDNLVDRLKVTTKEAQEPGVLLFADRSISYQSLFQVLDYIKQAGINRISLQAEIERNQ
jgi:biopolymer transport protein ExbD